MRIKIIAALFPPSADVEISSVGSRRRGVKNRVVSVPADLYGVPFARIKACRPIR
jgi:hypothetical protein